MRTFFRTFGFALVLSLAVVGSSWYVMGVTFAGVVLILGVLEFTLSFDNAIVNSKILKRMSPKWQLVFLTAGIAIAVVGMRLAFPILLVVLTAHLGVAETWSLALNEPAKYAAALHEAHPAIVGFAGVFLLMLFLDWIFEDHDLNWLGGFERALGRLGKSDIVASMIAFAVLIFVALYFSRNHTEQMLIAGVLGWLSYQLVNLLDELTEEKAEAESAEAVAQRSGGNVKLATGWAGFVLFLKLELIDASFSFDGVSGAFAVTSNIFAIMLGLGIGALWIRSLTVRVTRTGTLGKYVFLEHGAMYAIGSLAVLMFVGVTVEIPEAVTGLLGIIIIGAAYVSSRIYRKNNPEEVAEEAEEASGPLYQTAERPKTVSQI